LAGASCSRVDREIRQVGGQLLPQALFIVCSRENRPLPGDRKERREGMNAPSPAENPDGALIHRNVFNLSFKTGDLAA
jgi:hypothetical protein